MKLREESDVDYVPGGNIMLRLAAILLCLVIVSVWNLSGMGARFASGASGADTARVASFNVQKEGTLTKSFSISVYPGDHTTEAIEVTNNSEVAVSFCITITNVTNNLDMLDFYIDGMDRTVSGSTVSFTEQLLPRGEKTTLNLEIIWPEIEGTPDSNLKYIGMVDEITVSVTSTQID